MPIPKAAFKIGQKVTIGNSDTVRTITGMGLTYQVEVDEKTKQEKDVHRMDYFVQRVDLLDQTLGLNESDLIPGDRIHAVESA